MSVENLNVGGRFSANHNETARKQALARRAVLDADSIRNRQTLEKDSFLAFNHVESTETREAVASALSRLVSGEPALLISSKCENTRQAMNGGYCYARMQVTGEARYHDDPEKNHYAVIGEAAQYMLVGGGEASYVFRQPKPTKLKYQSLGIV